MKWRREQNPYELLKLWELVDDVIVTSQGVYLAGFELLGFDSEHTDISLAAEAANSLYDGFQGDLPEKTLLQFVVVSNSDYRRTFERFEAVPEPEDPVLAHQRQRRLDFLKGSNLRRYSVYVFVGRMEGFAAKDYDSLSQELHTKRVNEARATARKARMLLERSGEIKLCPLGTDQLTTLFDEALNPQQVSQHPVLAQDAPSREAFPSNASLDDLTCAESLLRTPISWEDDHLKIGKRLCKVLTLKALPDETRFTMMEKLFHLPFDYRASINLLVPEQAAYKRYLGRRHNVVDSMSQRKRRVSANAQANLRAAGKLESLVDVSAQSIVLAGMQIAIFGDTHKELDARTETTTSHLKTCKMQFFEENGTHDREFFKTLPGMATTFSRWRFATSNNAVDLMPLFTNAPGDDRPVFLVKNDRSELFSFDPMEHARKNWNAVVLGAPGAGKSVFMNMLITTAMLSNATKGRVVVVDFAGEEKSSYLNLVRLFGGKFVPLLSEKLDLGLNPFPAPRDALTEHGTIKKHILAFLTVVTDVLVGNAGDGMDALLYRSILRQGIIDLYSADRAADDAPLYKDLHAVIAGYQGNADYEAEKVSRLVQLLRGVLDDPNAQLLNRPANFDGEGSFVVYDLFGIEDFEPRIKEALVFTVCHHMRSLAFDAKDFDYKYVVLDEVAQLLKSPSMRETIQELYKTARKHNTAIWTATQNYADYVSSGVAGTVALCSDTHLFLSLSKAAKIQDLVIRDFSLEGREAHLFKQLMTRKGEFSMGLLRTKIWDAARNTDRDIRAVVKIELSPFDYELATSDPQDRQRQKLYLDANPGLSVCQVLDYLAYQRPNAVRNRSAA